MSFAMVSAGRRRYLAPCLLAPCVLAFSPSGSLHAPPSASRPHQAPVRGEAAAALGLDDPIDAAAAAAAGADDTEAAPALDVGDLITGVRLPSAAEEACITEQQLHHKIAIAGVREVSLCRHGYPQAFLIQPDAYKLTSGLVRLSCPWLVKVRKPIGQCSRHERRQALTESLRLAQRPTGILRGDWVDCSVRRRGPNVRGRC